MRLITEYERWLKMVKFENECCDCAVPGYPCIGDNCRLRHVKHIYCNSCGNEVEETWDGLCEECFIEESKNNAEHEKID